MVGLPSTDDRLSIEFLKPIKLIAVWVLKIFTQQWSAFQQPYSFNIEAPFKALKKV